MALHCSYATFGPLGRKANELKRELVTLLERIVTRIKE